MTKFFAPHNVKFCFGVKTIAMMPQESLPEFPIIGKSNVGKSSLINALTGNAKIAKVSKTPGATRQINFFSVSDKLYLVDLPGYGFANVDDKMRGEWEKLIMHYFENRRTIKIAFLLIDSRRNVQKNDKIIMRILNDLRVNFFIIFTKIDKLSTSELTVLQKESKEIRSFILNSSSKKIGVSEIQNLMLSNLN